MDGETLTSVADMEQRELHKVGIDTRGQMGGAGGPDSLWKVAAASQGGSRNQGIVVISVGSTN